MQTLLFLFSPFLFNKTTHVARRNHAKYVSKKVNSERIFCYAQINKTGMCLFAEWVSLWPGEKGINIGVGDGNVWMLSRDISQEKLY